MSKEVKVALVGAAATIVAAIIGGIFLLRSVSGPSTNPSDNTSTATVPMYTPQPGGMTPSITQPPQVTRGVDPTGATSTIDSFCQFVNSGAIQQAYNLTSSNYQSQIDVGQFTSQFNNANLLHGGCQYNHPTVSGSNVIVNLTMNRINPSDGTTSSTNYGVTLIQDPQSGFWKIDSFQPQ